MRDDGATEARRPGPLTTGAEPRRPERLAVCIATYRRNDGLRALIGSLLAQRFPGWQPRRIDIIVVDNNPDGIAEGVVRAITCAEPFRLIYVSCPEGGLSEVRNAALDAGAGDLDAFAMLDDDETASPEWLSHMVTALDCFQAQVVTGRIEPVLPEDAPSWLDEGGFFHRPRHETGAVLETAPTSNVLFLAGLVHDAKLRFRAELSEAGGEDHVFFREAVRAGYRIVWSDEAVVHDHFPASRVRPGWLLARSFRIGNTTAVGDRLVYGPGVLPKRLARALLNLSLGAAAYGRGAFQGRIERLRAAREIVRACGTIAGVLGYTYKPYRKR